VIAAFRDDDLKRIKSVIIHRSVQRRPPEKLKKPLQSREHRHLILLICVHPVDLRLNSNPPAENTPQLDRLALQ
jgi:hypothetical protein